MAGGRNSLIFPGKGRLQFDGGKNNKFDRSLIGENESPDCKNVVFSNAAVQTRGGSTIFNTVSVGSFAGNGLYTRKTNTGAESMVYFAGQHMYVLNVTTFVTVPSAQSVFTAGVRVGADNYENYLFIGNGGVTPYKYNGAFTRHGIPAPTTTSTVASHAAGVLTGDYRYKVTYVNSAAAEGNPGPSTTTFTAAGATLRVTSIPVAPISYGVNARNIYRTDAGGLVFKRLATINDNTTTTYDDNSADTALGANAPSNNFEPPNYSIIKFHQNRAWTDDPANPNFLWYSEAGNPYVFGATNFREIGDNAADLLRGIGVFDNSVFSFGDKTITLTYLTDPGDDTTWRDIVVTSSYGSKSHYGIASFQGELLFPAIQSDKIVGFGAIKGGALVTSATLLTTSSAGSELVSDRIEPDVFQFQEANVSRISSMVFKNAVYITVTYGAGNTANNRVYCYDYGIQDLSKKNPFSWVPFTGWNAEQFTIYNGNLYFADSTATGFVRQALTTSYDDDGAGIDSYLWTREISGGDNDTNFFKDFRAANLFYENSGDWEMDLNYRADSDIGDGDVQRINLNPGGSLWGSMVWGIDTWGGGKADADNRIFLSGLKGKRIQLKFSNQGKAGQKFKVYGLNLIYNKKGLR